MSWSPHGRRVPRHDERSAPAPRRSAGGVGARAAASVTALHASDDALLAGTYGDGLFRSADGGRSWERIEAGLTASTFRFVTAELAGTEPARVYRSSDGGRSWQELEGITRIPGHEQWFLPYSPRAGAARNAYVSGDRLLVAAEVAGLLRSDDGGRTLGLRAGRR